MHFEILVEDPSTRELLDILAPKILDDASHTYRLKSYRGVGHIPQGLQPKTDARHRMLLDQLPRLLRGYGRSLDHRSQMVVVVVDNDDRDCRQFLSELERVLHRCRPRPKALFRLAIEETEAWLLGDRPAILRAYPRAKTAVLSRYRQDSICGTWELLAEAIGVGGRGNKTEWARRIGSEMDVDNNASPSFRKFRDGLRKPRV